MVLIVYVLILGNIPYMLLLFWKSLHLIHERSWYFLPINKVLKCSFQSTIKFRLMHPGNNES